MGAAFAGMGKARSTGKCVLLVNGVPASGKSTVARALSQRLGWPILALDTLKQPFLDELPPGDRLFNRTLGRAAYRAMWRILAEAPPGGFVLDAWFGFQPPDRLRDGLEEAGIDTAAEVWCTAPPEEIGCRYALRVPVRGPGHPGLDYVPELVALAARARPTGLAPVHEVDTTRPLDLTALTVWAAQEMGVPL
jgi:glucokinase